jgi:hypothetical protein
MAGPVLFCLLVVTPLAAEPFQYPEGKHGKGSLHYVGSVPVLVVAGTPEEIGEQMGVLAIKPAAAGLRLVEQFLREQGLARFKPLLASVGNNLLARCPEQYRRELDAAARASGVDRDLMVIGNTFHDIRKVFGCAALMVAPERSATGGALMGRNLDYRLVPGMQAYSLVIVYRPDGKKPFAVVSFPGALLLGCAMSAMNADGLVFGTNDVHAAADGSPLVELKNMPTAVLARRILEECSTIAEAEKLTQANKPASRSIMVLCDREGGGVLEATPKTVAHRGVTHGLCVATNHFRTKKLCLTDDCPRATALARAEQRAKLGVADIAQLLGEAHQGSWTSHSLVFEPSCLKVHVALGDGTKSATEFAYQEIDLGKLLRP